MISSAIVLATLVVLMWWRARHLRAVIAFSERRGPLDEHGVIAGGDGFVLEQKNAPAILLLHGAGDTPQTFRFLAGVLHDRGFHVVAPLLPGHGRRVRDFSQATADALFDAALHAYGELRGTHEWVGIAGLSMGGALAAQLAADNPELPALALLAPYLGMPRRIERFARLAWLWGPLMPVVRSGDGVSVLDPIERDRSLAYGVFTPAALRALRTTMWRGVQALPAISAPTLVVQSRTDNRIAATDAQRAFDRLGAQEKHLEWTTGAAHIITVDYGKEHVADLVTTWMEQHLPSPVARR